MGAFGLLRPGKPVRVRYLTGLTGPVPAIPFPFPSFGPDLLLTVEKMMPILTSEGCHESKTNEPPVNILWCLPPQGL